MMNSNLNGVKSKAIYDAVVTDLEFKQKNGNLVVVWQFEIQDAPLAGEKKFKSNHVQSESSVRLFFRELGYFGLNIRTMEEFIPSKVRGEVVGQKCAIKVYLNSEGYEAVEICFGAISDARVQELIGELLDRQDKPEKP